MQTQATLARWLGRISRRNLVIALLVLTAAAGGWLLRPQKHVITVEGLGEPVTFVTTRQTVGSALQSQGIVPGANDRVQPPLETSLKGQESIHVSIRKAVALAVSVDGQERQVETAAETIRDLLDQLQIDLGDKDLVSVPLETQPAAGMQVRITRRSEQVVSVQEEIPFETITRDDPTLPLGTTEVLQEGEPGLKEVQRRVLLEDGREVGSEVIAEVVTKEPVDKVVAYGTLGVVSRGGQEYRYVQVLDMIATGYTAGKESNPDGNGYTYTGMKAERGVVAVDPRVIPLYTRVYVEGYGPAIAADIGGAIKGNKIDLCFDSVAEALEWGRRPVKVYVLSD